MDYTTLGENGPRVSRLGFGCCPMGGHGWGGTDERELVEAVHAALDGGVNLFDTADIYGLGRSETVLGRALRGRRAAAVVASKFGVRRSDAGKTFYDSSPAWIVSALDESLRRLGTDWIDLYQLHYWDGSTPFDDVLAALERSREQGKIRCYGITNVDPTDVALRELPAGLVSFSFEYSLANRRHEPTIRRLLRDTGLGFLSWGSLGQGILTGRYDETTVFEADDRRRSERYPNFHGNKLVENLGIVAEMRRVAASHPQATLAQTAIRWIVDHLGSAVALVGIKRPGQLRDALGAFGWSLTEREVASLDRVSANVGFRT